MIKFAIEEGKGFIDGDTKRGLKTFRRNHHISKIQHREALAEAGWSNEDWHAGAKESGEEGAGEGRRGALENLLAKTKHITQHHTLGDADPVQKASIIVNGKNLEVGKIDIDALRMKKLKALVSGSFGGSTDLSKRHIDDMALIEKLGTRDDRSSKLSRTANIYRRKSR